MRLFSLFIIINERPLLNFDLILRAYPAHHRGQSLCHPQRKVIAQAVGMVEREHLKPSHPITPDMDVQLFETSFGSLVVVVLLFSSSFCLRAKANSFGCPFWSFLSFRLVVPELSVLLLSNQQKIIPSFMFLSFFTPMFPSASLPACLPLSPPIASSLLLFACRRFFPSVSLGLR